jgi:hypothetical protein
LVMVHVCTMYTFAYSILQGSQMIDNLLPRRKDKSIKKF